MNKNHSIGCDFLDKYGVTVGTPDDRPITIDGEVTTVLRLCLDYCPYDTECVLVTKDTKSKKKVQLSKKDSSKG